jgi:hypothetical protein
MKRFFAIIAFLAGGISVEIVKPLNCTLMESSQPRFQSRRRRHKLRFSNGK